jgi:hypothetical protein
MAGEHRRRRGSTSTPPSSIAENGVSTWRVARLLGTSEQVIHRTYGHHCIEEAAGV